MGLLRLEAAEVVNRVEVCQARIIVQILLRDCELGQGKISKFLFTTATYCELVKGTDHL